MLAILTVLFFVLSFLYLAVQTQTVQRFLTVKLTQFVSRNLGIEVHVGGVNISLVNRVLMENVWIEDRSGDTLAYASQISAKINHLYIRNRKIDIGHLTLNHFRAFIRKDSAGVFNFQFLTHIGKKDSVSKEIWQLNCANFRLRNSDFYYREDSLNTTVYDVNDINFKIDHFRFSPDSINFRLSSLTLADSKGFFLTDMSADFHNDPKVTRIDNLSLATLNSGIENARLSFTRDSTTEKGKPVNMHILLDKAKISLIDLAFFIPALKGMDQNMEVTGEITGNPSKLKAKNLIITTGKNTRINCDLSLDMFEGINEPFIFLDLFQSQTDFYDISSIKLPDDVKMRALRFPENFYEAGIITYRGNFTGFPTDFVAFGTFNSQMGKIKSDLSFVPAPDGSFDFSGKIETSDFKIGNLYKTEKAGDITLNGMVKGTYDRETKKIDADFDGAIHKFQALGYDYSNIRLNGRISNREFDGNAIINDPHLQMNFSGLLNLNKEIPQFDFIMNLKKADLVALKLDTVQMVSDLALGMTANFSGSSIDNFDGLVQVYDAKYTNQNNTLLVRNLMVNTHLEEKNSSFSLLSDFLDASITGTYHFNSLVNAFRNVLAAYIPALGMVPVSDTRINRFDYHISCKNLDNLTSVFLPECHVKTPFTLDGKIDSGQSLFELNGKIPGFGYKMLELSNINVNINPESNNLNSTISFSDIRLTSSLTLKNFTLSAKASENHIHTEINWDNRLKSRYIGNLESEITFLQDTIGQKARIQIELLPSKIIIADSVWNLSPVTALVDSTDVTINGFSFFNGNQKMMIGGMISEDKSRQLNISLEGFDLGVLSGYIPKPTSINGYINGTIGISDFYDQRIFSSDLKITGMEYRYHPIGDISLVSVWDRGTETIRGDISIRRDNRTTLSGSGHIHPQNKEIDFLVDLNNQSLDFMNSLITQTFSNFHGNGSGKVRVSGTPERILMDGAVFCKNAGLTIDFTQVSYIFSDSVRFAGDRIIFRKIDIADITGNKGVFNGTIRHDSFRNMDFNLSVSSNKILAMNTTGKDSEIFYGKAVARGALNITGHDADVKLSGEFTSLPETSITIVLADETEVTRYDFVRFVQTGNTVSSTPSMVLNPVAQGLEVDLIIHATPEAKAQMIYNTQITDVIKAQGEGTLRFVMDKFENIFLYGNYTVEQGEYLFTLQDVIRKRFTVESGGSITWSGDPYNAIIDLQALYKLKASLYELMATSLEELNSKQRIPVDCRITLTGDLMRPDITLGIVFPAIEERLRDELQQFFSTQEDLNRQMLSLLVLGKFYTPDFVRGNYASDNSGLIGNTASDLFSNQLSNWLSQINKDVNVGVNYRPGNQLTDDEIELALSTQIFNDRVRINGNIGNNTNPNKSTNSELVGDFEIEVKLTQNGKLQLKAYNRSNNNLIYETAPYTQGLGISYKEEYNTFGELWKKFLGLFRK